MKLRDDLELMYYEDLFYDVLSRAMRPEDILASQDDIDKVQEALNIVMEFIHSIENSDKFEAC